MTEKSKCPTAEWHVQPAAGTSANAELSDKLLAAIGNLIGKPVMPSDYDAAAAALAVDGVVSVDFRGIVDGKIAVVAEDAAGGITTVYVVPGKAISQAA